MESTEKRSKSRKMRRPTAKQKASLLRKSRKLLPGKLSPTAHYPNPALKWTVLGTIVAVLTRATAELLLQFNTINRGCSPSRLGQFRREVKDKNMRRGIISMCWIASLHRLVMVDGGGRATVIATTNPSITVPVEYEIYFVWTEREFFDLYRTFDHAGKKRDKEDDCEVKAIQLGLPEPHKRVMWSRIATAISIRFLGKYACKLRSDDVAQYLDDEPLLRELLHDRFFLRQELEGPDFRLCQPGVMAAYLFARERDSTLAEEFFHKLLSGDDERSLRDSLPLRLREVLRSSGVGQGKTRPATPYTINGVGRWLGTVWIRGWVPFVSNKHRTKIVGPVKDPFWPDLDR